MGNLESTGSRPALTDKLIYCQAESSTSTTFRMDERMKGMKGKQQSRTQRHWQSVTHLNTTNVFF